MLNQNYYTYEQLAEYSGKSVRSLKEYEKKGLLIAKYPNAKKRFSPTAVENFLRGRKRVSNVLARNK